MSRIIYNLIIYNLQLVGFKCCLHLITGQKTKDKRQKTKDKGQKTKDKGQRTEQRTKNQESQLNAERGTWNNSANQSTNQPN